MLRLAVLRKYGVPAAALLILLRLAVYWWDASSLLSLLEKPNPMRSGMVGYIVLTTLLVFTVLGTLVRWRWAWSILVGLLVLVAMFSLHFVVTGIAYFSPSSGRANPVEGLFLSTAITLAASSLTIFLLFVGQGSWFHERPKRVA